MAELTAVQQAIRALTDGPGLTGEQAAEAMEELMTGAAAPAQVGAFLTALRIRGETPEVVAACSRVMQQHAEAVPVEDVIDICGTGGDGADTFNVSTAAGFVVAAAGGRVAKHGNRAASSKCGSADLLEALGATISLGGEETARIIDSCGFAFLFAQRFHPAMKHVGPIRPQLGVRTIFNLLGPLTNPASPRGQLAGVGAKHLAPLLAGAFALRGMPRALVVHSADGLDGISPAGPTHAWFVEDGNVDGRVISPEDFGLPVHPLSAVLGGTAQENAATMRAVFEGQHGPMADFVVLNSAAALFVARLADSLPEAAARAREALASGKAGEVLERYIALTQAAANG